MLGTVLLSCSTADDMSQNEGTQEQLDVALSVGNTEKLTRQGADIVQTEGQQFRGLKGLLAIPFTTGNQPITIDAVPVLSTVVGNDSNQVGSLSYYYMNHCNMVRGTDRVLVYAQATDISGKATPAENGKMETTLVDRMKPADITFNLSSIRNTTAVDDDAQALADYMTTIANTPGWSTTNHAQLKGLYLSFINADKEKTGLMAGSAAHVKAFVAALKTQLQAISGELSEDIIDNIVADDAIKNNTYPRSIGLPDGAAAMRWTSNGFSVRTEATTLDNINGITRWAYPADLWYFVDSDIYTSYEKVNKSNYEGKTWSEVLATYYTGQHKIMPSTRSVAVEKPLQYGVGRLQMTLTPVTTGLLDAKNEAVNNTTPTTMPMTAVIIGGQHTVGFDFKPQGEQSDVDARFIYDSVVGTTGTVNTMVLQSYDGEKVPIILEFENNTGQQFTGKDGIIYPGTRFYLIAHVDPAEGVGDASVENRVFTKDHTTVMTMKVTSLKNAYSCMPDLLAPRLEIGVEVTTDWIQSTTTTVIL